jgi:hypothetical protein
LAIIRRPFVERFVWRTATLSRCWDHPLCSKERVIDLDHFSDVWCHLFHFPAPCVAIHLLRSSAVTLDGHLAAIFSSGSSSNSIREKTQQPDFRLSIC